MVDTTYYNVDTIKHCDNASDFLVQRPGIKYNGRYTFTEYEAGMRSLRGRPRKFSQDDEERLRKQGIPRMS